MYDDVESDFWKDIFVHMQHKNMIRIGAERLSVQDAPAAFERFAFAHPDIKVEITNSANYVTWEIFITKTVKLRLFIQSQIKGTLLQRSGGDLVKIADAKFPNNPFPEIEEFLSNKNELLKELHHKVEHEIKQSKKEKLTGEFIKAHLKVKFSNQKDVVWSLENSGHEFKLHLQLGNDSSTISLDESNYINQIASYCNNMHKVI